MDTYMVSYDLIKRKDYPDLWKELNSFSTKQHLLGSTWIVESSLTPMDLCKKLIQHIDGDDKLIVNKLVVPGGSVWTMSFPDQVRTWLHAHLD